MKAQFYATFNLFVEIEIPEKIAEKYDSDEFYKKIYNLANKKITETEKNSNLNLEYTNDIELYDIIF